MELGTGVFLAGFALAVVWLFLGTKDRWNWRRIMRWLGGIALVVILLGAGVVYLAVRDTGHWAKAQTEFAGLRLGQAESDVRFRKGEPSSTEVDAWEFNKTNERLLVLFEDGKVRVILEQPMNNFASLLGIRKGDTVDDLTRRLGEPGFSSSSRDGMKRLYHYPQLHAVYSLEVGSVTAFGIYDPAHGPLKYSDDPAPAQP